MMSRCHTCQFHHAWPVPKPLGSSTRPDRFVQSPRHSGALSVGDAGRCGHNNSFLALLLLCLCGGLCGCRTAATSYSHPELVLQPTSTLAELPFANLSGHANAGDIAAELFQAALYSECGRCVPIVAQTEVRQAVQAVEDSGSTELAGDVARKLGVRLLVTGTVTEYTYKRTLGDEPAVGLSVQVLEVSNQRVLWRSARSATGHFAWIREDTLSRVTQRLCRELAADLCRQGCSDD